MLILLKAVLAVAVLIVVFGLGFLSGRSYQVMYRRMRMNDRKRRRQEHWQKEAAKAERIGYIYRSSADVTGCRGWQ